MNLEQDCKAHGQLTGRHIVLLPYTHQPVADLSNTSAITHSPLIMKLPVVRYSPVGAVLDTWRENQEEKGLYSNVLGDRLTWLW